MEADKGPVLGVPKYSLFPASKKIIRPLRCDYLRTVSCVNIVELKQGLRAQAFCCPCVDPPGFRISIKVQVLPSELRRAGSVASKGRIRGCVLSVLYQGLGGYSSGYIQRETTELGPPTTSRKN